MLPENWLEILKAEYPKRDGDNGWIAVRTLVPRALTAGFTWNRILQGTKNYREACDRKGDTGTGFVKQAKTFYGPNAYFDEWADISFVDPVKAREEKLWEALRERAKACGFRDPWKVESLGVYETALREHERESRVVQMRR